MTILYTIPEGALIELQMIGRLHGQRVRNVFHYAQRGPAVTDGEAALEGFCQSWKDLVGQKILDWQSSEYTCEFVNAQMLKPTRYRVVPLTVNQPGSVQQSSLPSGVAAVVSRQGIIAARRYQGRSYIAGVPVGFEENSLVHINSMDELETIGIATAEEILFNGGTNRWVPLTSGNTTAPVPSTYEVAQVFPRRELYYQRRRTVGRGE